MELKDELVAVIKTERRYTCDLYTHPLCREKKNQQQQQQVEKTTNRDFQSTK